MKTITILKCFQDRSSENLATRIHWKGIFPAQMKTNDVAEAYDSDSQVATHKESIELPSLPEENYFSN